MIPAVSPWTSQPSTAKLSFSFVTCTQLTLQCNQPRHPNCCPCHPPGDNSRHANAGLGYGHSGFRAIPEIAMSTIIAIAIDMAMSNSKGPNGGRLYLLRSRSGRRLVAAVGGSLQATPSARGAAHDGPMASPGHWRALSCAPGQLRHLGRVVSGGFGEVRHAGPGLEEAVRAEGRRGQLGAERG